MSASRVVACPSCGRPAEWSPQNRFRPFCSERCKLIDLGAWATERYRVAGQEKPESEAPDGKGGPAIKD